MTYTFEKTFGKFDSSTNFEGNKLIVEYCFSSVSDGTFTLKGHGGGAGKGNSGGGPSSSAGGGGTGDSGVTNDGDTVVYKEMATTDVGFDLDRFNELMKVLNNKKG